MTDAITTFQQELSHSGVRLIMTISWDHSWIEKWVYSSLVLDRRFAESHIEVAVKLVMGRFSSLPWFPIIFGAVFWMMRTWFVRSNGPPRFWDLESTGLISCCESGFAVSMAAEEDQERIPWLMRAPQRRPRVRQRSSFRQGALYLRG
ncbi:uncharacterized protein BJX67DRAFT_166525 [Aspergillus lucknowensis]|uniref:Uncharacterized protein n=1 Tax=Aspergillus lucknowensis TaxID=176173 RepID=A0ABR4M4S9_9EURO